MHADEPNLVTAILAGDTDRFAEVVARHDRSVRALVGRAVRDPWLREEVVQETFCLAFRNLGELTAPERLGAWLARIARNAVVDALRRRAVRRDLEQPFEARAGRGGIDELAVADRPAGRDDWIWEEVGRLAPDDRQVLALRYREGLSYAEIATRLRVPLSTVRGRIYEARRALRRRLAEKELEP